MTRSDNSPASILAFIIEYKNLPNNLELADRKLQPGKNTQAGNIGSIIRYLWDVSY